MAEFAVAVYMNFEFTLLFSVNLESMYTLVGFEQTIFVLPYTYWTIKIDIA